LKHSLYPWFRLVSASMTVSVVLLGCGSNLAFLAERSRTEAQVLQEGCHQAGLTGARVNAADSLVTESNVHWKAGDPLPAQQSSERASALFRLAMAESETIAAQASLDSTHVARVKEEERAATYQEFLNEARALKKP
jgi:hypothetical protein